MTTRTLLLPLISTAALALVVACSSEPEGAPSPAPDAGDQPDPGSSSGDTGTPPRRDGGTRPDSGGGGDDDDAASATLLVRGEISLVGMTTNDHAIYIRPTTEGRALEAVNLADRSISTIWAGLPSNAQVDVKGNVVAIWTGLDPATHLGSFSYWTPGKPTRRNVAEGSVRDSFWATTDGSLLAFQANALLTEEGVPVSAELALVSTASGTLTTVLAGDERIAIDAASCGSSIGFAGKTLVVAYCRSGDDSARLVTVPNVGAPARRVLVDGGLRPSWRADGGGSKIFVIAQADDEGRVVTDDGTDPAPVTPIEAGVKEAFMLRDGSAVVYRTAIALRRATLGTTPIAPVTIATGEARGILDVSADQTRILYHALEGTPVDAQTPDGERYYDLRTIATNAIDGTADVLVDTERALHLGLTGDGAHALYISKAPRLVSVATDGSGERSLPLDFSRVDLALSGAHAILTVNSRQLGTRAVTDLVHVDFSRSGTEAGSPATKTIAESVGSGGYRFAITSKKSLVYARFPQNGTAGLYRSELP